MNDRNAFLQGQGSPIKDDAAPPEQGWRGERSADTPATQEQRRHVPRVGPEVEEVSGTASSKRRGWTKAPMTMRRVRIEACWTLVKTQRDSMAMG